MKNKNYQLKYKEWNVKSFDLIKLIINDKKVIFNKKNRIKIIQKFLLKQFKKNKLKIFIINKKHKQNRY